MKLTISGSSWKLEGTISEEPSKSGNSVLLASSHGTVQTEQTHKGKPVRINVNISIPK